MEALDHARALNALLALPRLERMLHIYRTWVNVEGVEGGMALTRRELQCVLEFPALDQHVAFLFDTFQCTSTNRNTPRVDLATLLTTAAMLAQGALADKARFVFSLVDLDTEDDIVEAELALVISTCCNGLFRLRLVEEGDNLSEMDALAVAYEAFDFVELEDGDKMTFQMFLKWCVFHPRPRALLGRVSCIYSMCDAARRLKEALQERGRSPNEETFVHYNDMHFGSLDESAERVGVLVGPIVGKVETTKVHVLMEVDYPAAVKCFAFVLPQEGVEMEKDCSVPTQKRLMKAFDPAVFVLSGLFPATTYVLRFLGIRKADRERCVAVITTTCRMARSGTPIGNSYGWRIRLVNHIFREGKHRRTRGLPEAQIYQKLARDSYQSPKPILTVHRGICLSLQRVSAMLQMLEYSSRGLDQSSQDQFADKTVLDMIRQSYRNVLSERGLWGLLRSHSNWCLDDNESVLFSGFYEWRSTRKTELSKAQQDLTRLALPVWQSYIGSLWGQTQNYLNCLELDDEVIFVPIVGHCNLQSGEVAFSRQITAILKEYPSPSAILLATSFPLVSQTRAASEGDGDIDNSNKLNLASLDNARLWRLLQELIEWNLSDLKRQIILLSFEDEGGYKTLLNIKNEALSLTQLICGPVVGTPPPSLVVNVNVRQHAKPTDQLVIQHGEVDRRPQYVHNSSVGTAVSTGGRQVTDIPYARCEAQLVPLQGLRRIHRILGPIVGCVSSRVARVLIECDGEGDVACVAVDRLTLEECRVVKRIEAYRPAIFTITKLTPGRTYDLLFQGFKNEKSGVLQTPHEHLPAFRLVVVSEDRFLDGTAAAWTSSDDDGAEPTPYIGNVTNHILPLVGTLQANVTVHIGCVVALAHDFHRKYTLLGQDQQHTADSKLRQAVRCCVRQHWNTPKIQQLLAHGSHWFSSIGALRALMTMEDVPVSFLRIVQQVLAEYEQVGDFRSYSALPSDRYLYRLQNGVAVLMIDTLESILDSAELTPFVQLPEMLLTTSQWTALEIRLQVHADQTTSPNTLVIMCDIPLISHRGKSSDRYQSFKESEDGADVRRGTGAPSWGMYPKEQARLLHLIFRKLQKHPKFNVVFVCNGAHASRTTIAYKSTMVSFQQIVVGPISLSGISSWPGQGVTKPAFGDDELADCYSIHQEISTGAAKSQQYCTLELVPHPLGPSSDVKFYVQHHGEARLLLGPIIGRVTPKTARILIELDRPVPNLVCTLTDPATLQSYSTQVAVESFTPTILKVDGLQPGTRYAIKFEGLMESVDTALGHVLTPAWISLTSEWLVVNCNVMANFLDGEGTDLQSQWPRILQNGLPSFAAQLAGATSHRNGDFLGCHGDDGQQTFNPWHQIADEYLSEPLSSPQLLLHLGGQVDMSRAFANEELASLTVRLAKEMDSSTYNEDSEAFQLLRSEIRYRLQEVYRVAWGVPPMKRLLGYCSNLMLLNESSDLYFTQDNLRRILNESQHNPISEAGLTNVVGVLRQVAFELWQLYQNQLWVDLVERELKYGSKSSGNKAAFSTTFGINRMVIANTSHEVHEYCNAVEVEAERGTSASVPLALDEPTSTPSVNLFSAASWKVVDEALETSSTSTEVERARSAPTKLKNPVQQLVLVVSGDLMEWGGSKLFPALRSDIVKVFEKLFAWKCANRVRREVAVICCRTNGSSITFEVTDEKLSEKLTLTCVGSVSEARELLHRDQKKTRDAAPALSKRPAISKGYFSKRFSYRSITNTTSTATTTGATTESVAGRGKQTSADSELANRTTTRCRTFASYRFVTDYRRGFLDETLYFFPSRVSLPKVVLGPVIGRMVFREAPKAELEEPLAEGDPGDPVKMHFSVPILLEINANARVVCVVTDILANQDVRVTQVLTRFHPHVFEIPSLIPERRYVYHFEGIANSESRRGSFHTPPSSSSVLNFLAVSSNFPEQMEEATDSLWKAIKERVQASWCGLDMILHLGGQVPMHEAAFECFEWARRELKLRENSTTDGTNSHVIFVRRKIRQRLQQRYRLCWNVPNVRETLAYTSNWFLRSQADIAPFFRNHEILYTQAAQLVLSEAKQVIADYQLSLMQRDFSAAAETNSELPSPILNVDGPLSPGQAQDSSPETSEKLSVADKVSGHLKTEHLVAANEQSEHTNQNENETANSQDSERTDTSQFILSGEIGVFMCDMRSTPRDDVVTCNDRLVTPLTQQERAVIGEKQWQQFEKALKKKAVMAFVLCMELPLVLTDAKCVDAVREEATLSGTDTGQEETVGRWKLYDRLTLSQHWVSCRRQLEQLLNLLFRWKAKHRGREVIVLSGGMRAGLETILQDHETKLSIRNLAVGPLTAHVQPDFDNLSLEGIPCPTFLGSGSQRDERFTFAHTVVANKNYLLTHAVITHEKVEQSEERGEAGGETKSANIQTEFIADDGGVDVAHPVNLYQRFPTWWTNYVPMGRMVFWDDTVTMRAQSDEDVTALAQYLQDGREFTAALEVLFEKHQFAEAARMEELRSKHRRRQRGPEELRASLRAVFAELWKVLPDTYRQRVAYFQDEFVFDFLLGYLAPTLFEGNEAQDGDVERPPLEFAAFSTLCRDFIFNAGVLNLSLTMHQEDELRAIALRRAEARHQAAEREKQRIQLAQQRVEEEAELLRLQQEDPEAFAKRKMAEQEIARKEKLAKAEAAREQRKAEKLRDVEEELAIAKEQRKLDKLAETGNDQLEFARRRDMLVLRVRKFEERKRHREADEARRRDKKEKKRKEKAAH